MADPLKIAFVKARWHGEIVDQALFGFEERLRREKSPAEIATFDVPGAFEMPLLAKRLGESGRYDALLRALPLWSTAGSTGTISSRKRW